MRAEVTMKAMRRSFGNTLAAITILAAGWGCNAASAAFVTWNAGTGDWFVGTNWDFGAAPAVGDTAIVANGGTALAGASVAVTSLRLGSAESANAAASGSAEIAGDLTLSQPLFVGRAFGAGSTASGRLAIAGTLGTSGTTAPFAFWEVGRGFGGVATGHVNATSVDTTGAPLAALSVGFAGQGGRGTGSLSLGSGDLTVGGSFAVEAGVASGQQGAMAQGALSLGGTLAATGVDRRLQVGTVFGGPTDQGAGRATGTVEASGLAGFRFVDIGRSTVVNGLADAGGNPLVTASGQATIGAGGIVNADGNGTLDIGLARGLAVNGLLFGPGASVEGSATVGGNISGYDVVSIGRVENTGRARGSLDLTGGTLTTEFLRVGSVQSGTATASGAVATDAEGRLSVVDGAVVIRTPNGPGRTEVGGLLFADPNVANSARGRLDLTRSSFTGGVANGSFLGGGFLDVGVQGGQGVLNATDNSTLVVNALTAATNFGSATVTLTDSQLAVRADAAFPITGSMLIGTNGGSGQVVATRSGIVIDENLLIAAFSGIDPTVGRVSIVDGTLEVGGFVGIGSFGPDSLGELALVNSTGTVGDFLRLGLDANNGTLFGDASLEIDGSLLTIGTSLIMDTGAAPGLQTVFGVDGVTRGLGGYGAIDVLAATLAGHVLVDFGDLDLAELGDVQSFDLIFAEQGFGGSDFGSAQFVNLGTGYRVSTFGVAAVDGGEVWRVTLAAAAVPEPGTLALALVAGVGVGFARRCRAARCMACRSGSSPRDALRCVGSC